MKSQPEINVIYCDDVRFEIGAKQSYIGVYMGELLVPDFPALIPKICIQAGVKIPLDIELNSLDIRCKIDDDVVNSMQFEQEQLRHMQSTVRESLLEQNRDSSEIDGFLWINAMFTLESLNLSDKVRIRVRAFVNDEEYKGNALIIRKQSEQERAALLAASPNFISN